MWKLFSKSLFSSKNVHYLFIMGIDPEKGNRESKMETFIKARIHSGRTFALLEQLKINVSALNRVFRYQWKRISARATFLKIENVFESNWSMHPQEGMFYFWKWCWFFKKNACCRLIGTILRLEICHPSCGCIDQLDSKTFSVFQKVAGA